MKLSFLDWPIAKQLSEEKNPLSITRIRALSYSVHLRLLSTSILLALYIVDGNILEIKRVGFLMLVVVLYYIALARGLHWEKAIHIAIVIFYGVILSNLFVLENGFHLVSMQYVLIISIYGFYGLGNKWGAFYALGAMLPFLIYMFMENHFGVPIPWGPQGASMLTIMIQLFHNFFFFFIIHYYFFNSFYCTINALDNRTTELTASLAFLEDSQKKLEAEFTHQRLLLASISHDIKSPLRFLMTTTERLARTNPELPTVRAISQSSYRLYHFMKNLLEYTKFRYRNTLVKFSYLDVYELINQKFAIFAAEADSNANTFINAAEQDVILKNNLQLLSIILHNLIDNANKVTHNGTIEVAYIDDRETATLVVKDTGPGMDPLIIKWINSDSKVPNGGLDAESFGMGLVIVKEASALINARLFAEPNGEQGVAIHIILQK